MLAWLPWTLLPAAAIHMTEEFAFPGGFIAWYKRYRVDASRITPRFLFILNAALLVVCLNIGFIGRDPIGVAYWLGIAALLGMNGIWDLWASYKSRSYSPGVVTGMLIYVPLAIYGYIAFVRAGKASIRTAAIAAIIGGSYQLWSALFRI